MKFTFLCAVIVLSCSVCASGDLEIYPGYDFNSQQRRRFQNEGFPRWRPSPKLPLGRLHLEEEEEENDSKEQSLDLDLRQFEEFLSKNQKLPYDYYEDLDKTQINPARQALDDVRPYPEDDFSFRDEQTDENDGKEESFEEESSQPDDFAYLPSDPRFFQNYATYGKVEKSGGEDEEQKDVRTNKQDKILVDHRSESYDLPLLGAGDGDDDRKKDADVVAIKPQMAPPESAGVYVIAVIAGISAAAIVGLIAVGIGWYNLQKHVKNASDVEYPAYGVTGPNKDISPSGDRRLAQSAQMYHYQHQKQQIIAMESRAAAGERHGSVSEAESEDENEEGDYTVYECPGLAPTGEMEVKNPLFHDDPTPAQISPGKEKK